MVGSTHTCPLRTESALARPAAQPAEGARAPARVGRLALREERVGGARCHPRPGRLASLCAAGWGSPSLPAATTPGPPAPPRPRAISGDGGHPDRGGMPAGALPCDHGGSP